MQQLIIAGALACSLLAAGLGGCKTAKETTAPTTTETPAATAPTPTPATTDVSPVKAIPQEHQDDVTLMQQYPDSVFFRMQRTSCYGQCPVYTLEIYHSGYATYTGKHHVEHEGDWYTWFTPKELAHISSEANRIAYFDLLPVYDRGVTDFPTTYTYLNFDGYKNAIKNRQSAPRELKDFEKMVDEMVAGKELTKKR